MPEPSLDTLRGSANGYRTFLAGYENREKTAGSIHPMLDLKVIVMLYSLKKLLEHERMPQHIE